MSQKEELNELLNKILDPKTCIGCGQRKGYTDRNYAGFDVISEGNYPFPQRITPLAIPGVKSKGDYLCFKCVNSFKVNCRVHGIVKDDNFNGARPPRCFKCEAQLNKINKGELPDGFWCLIPLSQIAIGSKTLNNEGILACSDDGEAHIINKGVLLSSSKHFTPQVATANNNVILKLTSFSHKIQSCFIELKNKELLNKGHGPWVNLWNHEIRKKLNLNDQFPSEIVICDIELTKAANGTFDIVREKYPISLLTIENGNFKIYPKIPLPGLKGLTRWHFSSAMQTLQLAINLEGVPHTITLSECFNCAGFGSLHDMSKKMPEYLETSDQDIFNLEGKAVCEVKHFPKYERFKCLFELNSKTKSISATSIPKEKQLTFDLCFSHKQNILLISLDTKQYFTCFLSKKDIELIKSHLPEPKTLFDSDHYRFGVFLDGKDHGKARILQVYLDGIVVDNIPIKFSNLKNSEIISVPGNMYELSLKYLENNSSYKTIKIIGPESLSYSALKEIDVNKAEFLASGSSLPQLYNQYNKIKKQNLLIGLFSDIILLSRELDFEMSVDELAEKLEKMSVEEFFNNKNLFQKVIKKLLLFNLFLPKIKQNYEYLSSFYPYYLLKNEGDIISKAFGPKVAEAYIPSERRTIRSVSRANVRNVQANFQRTFFEIERAIAPIEHIFAKEKIDKDLFFRITKHFPAVGQATLIGTLIATGTATGGVGILAGMFGIRMLGDALNYLKNNRESAARIKKAAGIAFSWWRVFKDNLPVAIYEAGEEIDLENIRCMRRDKNIFDQFPLDQKNIIQENLRKCLTNKIHEGTINRFVELLEGSGIKFRTLASDIETAIEKDMPKRLRDLIETLPIPHGNSVKEVKNG